MKGLNRWLNTFQKVAPLYAALGRLSGLSPREVGGRIGFPQQPESEVWAARPEGVSADDWAWFVRSLADRPADDLNITLIESWALSGLAASGPRVYRPTAEEFLALAQIETNVPWPAYRQPFDTFLVAYPDALSDRRVSADVGVPAAILGRLDADRRVMAVALISGDSFGGGNNLVSRFAWPDGYEVPIEEHVRRLPVDHARVTADEDEESDRAVRVLVNACLLLTQYGHRSLGKSNPEYAARLEASLRKKGLPESVRRANRAALHALPELIGFDQHVRVYDHAGEPHGGGGERGEVRPHWRRGHWANVACGTGRAERRLVFRRPVLVHADRFAGSPADTRVTLTTAR